MIENALDLLLWLLIIIFLSIIDGVLAALVVIAVVK